MAAMAISIRRRMSESFYIPCCNSMTCPAVIAEFAAMGFKMTLGAREIAVKKRVIDLGYIRTRASMFRMTTQAVFPGLVKTNLGFKRRHILKIVALQTTLI
jgi:hypothetical protein